MKQNSKTYDLVITGLLTALVFIFTKFINIRLPFAANGGLIHLGNIMMVITCIVFGRKKGAISGALGMALFDLLSGWAIWAPFTFVIRGGMGYLMGALAKDGEKQLLFAILAVTVGSIWMVFGYYISEVIMYGNPLIALGSIPGDITQATIGGIVGIPAGLALRKRLAYRISSREA